MSFIGLILKSISRSPFRSIVVFLCVMFLAGFSLAATLVVRGSEHSLEMALSRLGADIVVVPKGVEGKVETALLTGKPTSVWMPKENLEKIRAVPGLAIASPQIYLASLSNAACCAVSEMFLIVFDPPTDFTIQPWLREKLGRSLSLGEAVGGDYVFVPYGDDFIMLYGYFLTLKGNLEPTGTGIDQTMFINLDTAQEMARMSIKRAEQPLEIPPDKVSAVMIRVQPGTDPHAVALQIGKDVPGVSAIESANLFQSVRKQLTGLVRSIFAILAVSWVVSIALIGMVFSITTNERRREIGVLRALGSTRRFVFQSLLAEAAVLAVAGGLTGCALAVAGVTLFKDLITTNLRIPFLFPSLSQLALLVGLGLAVGLASITVAALVPAASISRLEPAVAMRE